MDNSTNKENKPINSKPSFEKSKDENRQKILPTQTADPPSTQSSGQVIPNNNPIQTSSPFRNPPSSNSKNNSSQKQQKDTILINNIPAEGGAYKGCPKHDYSLQFVLTGKRPQNFVRDYEEERRFLEYPKLNELIKLKNEVLQKRATPPMYLNCDLKNFDLTILGKFDVILIDPPLPEYYERAKSFNVDLKPFTPWTYDEIQNLRIDLIADNCSFLFLWVGAGEGLDVGRNFLKKWGFRRCEDIVWIKTNKLNNNNNVILKNDNSLLIHTKEHCLVGIKGAIKRGVDGHFIHANVDTDVIVGEEPPFGSTEKPEELYKIIERFCLGRKRLELFGEDRNKRAGWLTLGNRITGNNFSLQKYNEFFEGTKIYPEVQGYQGGRYVGTTLEIENLRPKSPVRAEQQNTQGNNVGIEVQNNNIFNYQNPLPNPIQNLPMLMPTFNFNPLGSGNIRQVNTLFPFGISQKIGVNNLNNTSIELNNQININNNQTQMKKFEYSSNFKNN